MTSVILQTTNTSEESDTAPSQLTPLSSEFKIDKTVYGGRGCFALAKIPKGTVVLECDRPIAFSVTKDFKKEVCNWCFHYGNGTTMKYRLAGKNGKYSINFCSQVCLNNFTGYDYQGLLTETLLSIESIPIKEEEEGSKLISTSSRKEIDLRWENIKKWEIELPKKTTKRQKFIPRAMDEEVYLELKYLAVALFEIVSNGNQELEYFETLQSNEYDKIMKYPQILDIWTKCFQILKLIFPKEMQTFITTDFVRKTLGKESGNAFGIWSPQVNDEYQEYMGFGLYPRASFFNHSCCPNLKKTRENAKLVFRAIKDIEPNEEMYINYGSTTEENYQVRQASLKEWFFECACQKCSLDEITSRTEQFKL